MIRNGKGGKTIAQSQKKANAIKKEDAILEAAMRVMADKGFHKARMLDIAEEAGISYGLIYHYYKNKKELLNAIIDQYFDDMYSMVYEILESDQEADEKIRQFALFILDNYQRRPELFIVFTSEVSRSTAKTKKYLLKFKGLLIGIDEMILDGQKKGSIRDDFKARYLTYLFLGSIEIFISAMVLDNQRIRSDEQKKRIAEGIYQLFMYGVTKRNI